MRGADVQSPEKPRMVFNLIGRLKNCERCGNDRMRIFSVQDEAIEWWCENNHVITEPMYSVAEIDVLFGKKP
jgi:hypothetical protein